MEHYETTFSKIKRFFHMKLPKYSRIGNINTHVRNRRNRKLHNKVIISIMIGVVIVNVLLYLLFFDNSLISEYVQKLGPLLQGSGF